MITTKFYYWFCENYYAYAGREQEMPFDQHYLLASIAPRKIHVASAEEDLNADPVSEFLNCVAASDAYSDSGLICEDRLSVPGDHFHSGNIGYSYRGGPHFFSREDWLNLISYLKNHEE